MLENPIYRGEYVWNRSEWIKDHETGKRRRFVRPESEWIRQHSPAWQIVSAELWERVRSVAAAKRSDYVRSLGGRLVASRGQHGASRQPLSGLLECSECGGSVFRAWSNRFYACGWHRDRGSAVCGNAMRVPQPELEARVFGAIRDQVLVPDVVAYAVQCAIDAFTEAMQKDDPRQARARLREIDRELANLARYVAKTGKVDAAAAQYAELDAERARLLDYLTELPVFDPGEIRRAAEVRVLALRQALEHGPESRAALRSLLANRRLRVGPDPERGFRVEGLLEVELETRTARGGAPELFNGAGTCSDRTDDGSVQNDGNSAAEDDDLSRVAFLNAEERPSRLRESREVRGRFIEDFGCGRLVDGEVDAADQRAVLA